MGDFEAVLSSVGHLEDAVLEAIEFERHLSRVRFRFDWTWSGNAPTERDDRAKRSGSVVLDAVLEFRFNAALPDLVLKDPSLLGWSHNEIAVARIDESDLPSAPTGWHWLTLFWETDRRIDVMFATLWIENDGIHSLT